MIKRDNNPEEHAKHADERIRALEARVRELEVGSHLGHVEDDELIRGCPECESEMKAREKEK